VSPTDDMGKILNSLHDVKIGGSTNLAAAIQIAQLALKHRRNKHGGQRLVLFVASPITDDVKSLVKVHSCACCATLRSWSMPAMLATP
jgi:26S proteasome regulatory subunit N10